MYTAAELKMIRKVDPSVQIAGVDTAEGARIATSALKSVTSLSTDQRAGIYYQPTLHRVIVKQAGAVLSGYDFGDCQVTVCAPNVTIVDCTFSGVAANNYGVRLTGNLVRRFANLYGCQTWGAQMIPPMPNVWAVDRGALSEIKSSRCNGR